MVLTKSRVVYGCHGAKSPSGHLVLKSQLIAFRNFHGSHTGVNIGKVFVQIIKEIGCLHKISMITLDNASNNNTSMEKITVELHQLNIPFDEEGNRIWCFPHVVNIAVKAGLKHLTTLPLFDPDLDFNADQDTKELPDTLCSDIEYYNALKSDVVSAARRLVTACRASGQCHEDLEDTIIEGNNKGGWGEPPELLQVVCLLKDVDTRWSLTFLMIDRVLELNLVSCVLHSIPWLINYVNGRRLMNFLKTTMISHITLCPKLTFRFSWIFADFCLFRTLFKNLSQQRRPQHSQLYCQCMNASLSC